MQATPDRGNMDIIMDKKQVETHLIRVSATTARESLMTHVTLATQKNGTKHVLVLYQTHRLGQHSDVVHVHVIKASMAGYAYDQNKWIRIEFKRSLADCAVDGRIPKGILQTKEQMQQELIKWLERLERNEISILERRNLNVEPTSLSITQRQQLQRNLGEFSRMNSIINNAKSQTIHNKIQQDPHFLLEYHEKLDEKKKLWEFDPVNIIANKINGLKWPANVIMKLVIGDFGCGRARLAELLKEN
jgi:hypothetical protein